MQDIPVDNVFVCVCTGICRNYTETTEVQGLPVDNVLGVCVCVCVCVYGQESVGITVKHWSARQTCWQCPCVYKNYSQIIEVQGVPVDNVLVCIGNYSKIIEVQGVPVDNVFVCIGITVKLLKCNAYLLTMSLCV